MNDMPNNSSAIDFGSTRRYVLNFGMTIQEYFRSAKTGIFNDIDVSDIDQASYLE